MKTNWQDPQTSEIRSTHISGLQDAIGKIEDVLDLKLQAETNVPLTEVYISELDRYRIYQAPAGKRNWASTPSPVIKKNGVVVSSGFTIDYGGGAIIVSPSATSTDTFTADVSYTKTADNALATHLADTVQTTEVNSSTKYPSAAVTYGLQQQINNIISKIDINLDRITVSKLPLDYTRGLTIEWGDPAIYDLDTIVSSSTQRVTVITWRAWSDVSVPIIQIAIGHTRGVESDYGHIYMRRSTYNTEANVWRYWVKSEFVNIV